MRRAALILSTLLLVVLGLRWIVPLLLLLIPGFGVALPFPATFSESHPQLAILLFIFGGPVLFLVLLGLVVFLVRAGRVKHVPRQMLE